MSHKKKNTSDLKRKANDLVVPWYVDSEDDDNKNDVESDQEQASYNDDPFQNTIDNTANIKSKEREIKEKQSRTTSKIVKQNDSGSEEWNANTKRQSSRLKKATEPERKFECDLCDKNYTRKSRLVSHKLTKHTPKLEADDEGDTKPTKNDDDILNKPYHCTICLKSFTRRDHLNRHLITHSGIRPFACDICGRDFSRRDNRVKHRNLCAQSQNSLNSPKIDRDLIMNENVLAAAAIEYAKENHDKIVSEIVPMDESKLKLPSSKLKGLEPVFKCKFCKIQFTRRVLCITHMRRCFEIFLKTFDQTPNKKLKEVKDESQDDSDQDSDANIADTIIEKTNNIVTFKA